MPNVGGFGRGFGFRGYSPPWPYVGRGRGGLPRCWAGTSYYSSYPVDYAYPEGLFPQGVPPFGTSMPPEQELTLLKHQAELLKKHLEQIDERVKELESLGR